MRLKRRISESADGRGGAHGGSAPGGAGDGAKENPLTPRETEVLGLLAAGRTNRQVAAELHLSLSTVKRHVEHIIRKLGVSDRTQAAVKAMELGIVTPRFG